MPRTLHLNTDMSPWCSGWWISRCLWKALDSTLFLTSDSWSPNLYVELNPLSTFSSIGAVLSILQTDRTLPSVECPPPAVAGTFQPGLARPAAAVLLVHAAGLVKLDQLGLEGHAAGLAAPLCTKGPK